MPTVEKGRITTGPYATPTGSGPTGMYHYVDDRSGARILALASTGEGWEHVSVSVRDDQRCPTWEEMTRVKTAFWRAEEEVVQYHPRASEYVNRHPYVLHLWRPLECELPRPPTYLIG